MERTHYLKNVYITAFNRAIQLDNVTDIGRLEGVHLSPAYLTDNAYAPFSEADAQSIRDYMFENATGLYMVRSDWEYVYDFTAKAELWPWFPYRTRKADLSMHSS